jgi:uncharacterized membrane protein
MKQLTKELLLPIGLLVLTFSALLSSILRLVLVAETPTLDINTLDAIDIRYVPLGVATVLHVLPGLIFLLIGLVQFMPALRRHALPLHRWMGRIFIISGLISGVSVLWLSMRLPAMGGLITLVGTWIFAIAMMACLVTAYRAIRRMDVTRHRSFMIRAYAIGSAVATTRLVGLIGTKFLGLDFITNFGYWLWIAMLIHVFGAEFILARGKT